jgi:hypothetical protein
MYMRVSKLQSHPDKVDDVVEVIRSSIIPALQQQG